MILKIYIVFILKIFYNFKMILLKKYYIIEKFYYFNLNLIII